MRPWPEAESKKSTFLNLYRSPAEHSTQGEMLKGLRNHNLNLCPSCGQAGQPNTLDHYLPKDDYPHFCVTPLNLFPMCSTCQTKKGTSTGDNEQPRFFIHPYFDLFVAERVIEVKIEPPFDAPSFKLRPDSNLVSSNLALVKSHIRELELEQRYAHFFREQYIRLLKLVSQMRSNDIDVEVMLNSCRIVESDPCKNSWMHIFYACVTTNTELLVHLKNGQLPEYI